MKENKIKMKTENTMLLVREIRVGRNGGLFTCTRMS